MIDMRSTGVNCLVALSDALGRAAPLEMEQVSVLMFIKYARICDYYTWPTLYML